jgi:ferredoxin-NADP reductase/MOSC domain-containing protein YiiM
MSRVIAVSVAMPRWHDIRGHQVFTSIVRNPSNDPIQFGMDGPLGNATAVHTEQVLAFSAEHYDHWTRELNVDRSTWDWCFWGENITLTGIDENDLRIGDVIEIGSSARFEVTSPRIPCFKLAWRIGQPDTILKTMVETGFIGFYLSVVRPGLIGPGDKVTVRRTAADAITVGDLSRMLIGIGEITVDAVRKVLALPALGGQARGMLAKRLTAMKDGERLSIGRWKGWRAFDVEDVIDEADDVRSFVLKAADGQPIAPYRAGQFLTVRLSDKETDNGLSRVWSLSDYDDRPERYRITVKRAIPGVGSAWMHDWVLPGSRLLLRPPAGRFTLDRSGFMRTILISAGIGVTPMLAMLKAHAARGKEAPPLIWIHATANSRSHVHAKEANAILKAHDFQRSVFYTMPLSSDEMYLDYDMVGRPTADNLAAIIDAPYVACPFGRDITLEGRHSDVYLCGPPSFENDVRTTLVGIGIVEEQIHTERFSVATGSSGVSPIEKADIFFEGPDVAAQWTCDEDLTLLELAESVNLSLDHGCRMGRCGACEVTLIEGAVTYDPKPAVVPPAGKVLSCCARPATANIRLRVQTA